MKDAITGIKKFRPQSPVFGQSTPFPDLGGLHAKLLRGVGGYSGLSTRRPGVCVWAFNYTFGERRDRNAAKALRRARRARRSGSVS